jgi:hypothetical protein
MAGLLPGVLGLSPPAAAAARADSVHTFLTGAVALSAAGPGWAGAATGNPA